ncbi:uncharacterized protein EV422DRAFT_507437 [Fimicolochytrium jonesii]|uniref:uncharacterized protein n=1 Tax=Fimicolochytrium jonesii TaxID=1396493 RepID=UPI0022FE2D02|nr:uncharacterized protein EV422DRAFT_507437 [Fimicolochytrium jonesii]KAI8819357.1 hypothetical protein EV422DRAFT_507437 [Fimicolochytrium jonesii]
MFSFGQAPKVSIEEARENRAKVKSSLTTFVTVVAVFRAVPFVVEYVKELFHCFLRMGAPDSDCGSDFWVEMVEMTESGPDLRRLGCWRRGNALFRCRMGISDLWSSRGVGVWSCLDFSSQGNITSTHHVGCSVEIEADKTGVQLDLPRSKVNGAAAWDSSSFPGATPRLNMGLQTLNIEALRSRRPVVTRRDRRRQTLIIG